MFDMLNICSSRDSVLQCEMCSDWKSKEVQSRVSLCSYEMFVDQMELSVILPVEKLCNVCPVSDLWCSLHTTAVR